MEWNVVELNVHDNALISQEKNAHICLPLTNNKIKFNYTRFIADANDLCAYQIEDNSSIAGGEQKNEQCFDQQFIN